MYMRTIPVSDETKSKLDKLKHELNMTWDEVIKHILSVYEKTTSIPDVSGLSSELLATVGVIYIMRNNKGQYLSVINYLSNKQDVKYEDVLSVFGDDAIDILDMLNKYRIVHMYDTPDGLYVKLLCIPQEIKRPDYVTLRIMFTPDFCRIYCTRVDTCFIYKRICKNNTLAGRDFMFRPEEYEKCSIEELIGKCVTSCIEG